MIASKWIVLLGLIILVPLVHCKPLVGLLQDVVEQDFNRTRLSKECKSDLIKIRTGLRNREIWALKLLDASSYLSSDFVWGNNIFIGSPRSCNLVNKPHSIKVSDQLKNNAFPNLLDIGSPFPVEYRAVHAKHKSKMQFYLNIMEKDILDLGFCMPQSCNNRDFQNIFQLLFTNASFTNTTLLGNEIILIKTKNLKITNNFFDSSFVQGFLYITAIIVFLTIVDLGYKLVKRLRKSLDNLSELTIDIQNNNEKINQKSIFEKLLECFSIIDNCKSIFRIQFTDNAIPTIHGLRVISMIFFISGHIIIFGVSTITNPEQILLVHENFWLQPLFTMRLQLGTFFVLSGTLSSYVFFQYLKTHKIKNNCLTFITSILYRYIRLTPPYAIQILMAVTVNRLVKQLSPYYLIDDNETKCEKYWWYNIIYINNFGHFHELCIVWGWFLSADFQWFTITTILLLIYNRKKFLGISLFVILLLSSMIVCAYYGYILSYSFTPDTIFRTGKYLYLPPWVHAGSYLTGIFVGCYLSTHEKQLKINKNCVRLLWLLSFSCIAAQMFSHLKNDIPPISGIIFATFHSLTWGLAIGWIILATATGHGGIMTKILSSDIFVPLSRLCYAAYLVNPSWIIFTQMLNQAPLYVDYAMLPIIVLGYLSAVFIVAFVFSVLFEAPFIRLNKIIFSRLK